MRRTWGVILVAVLSGCITPMEQTANEDLAPAPFEPQSPLLADCVSYGSGRIVPSALLLYDGPEEWRHSAPVSSVVAVLFIECQKVTWGPYSRGPVLLATMSHSGLRPPEACLPSGAQTSHYLMGFWTDDPEIAAYVNSTIGLPLTAADISYDVLDAGVFGSRTMHLDTGLFEASIPFNWQSLNSNSSTDQFVFFRANSTTVTRMTLYEEYTWPAPDLVEALGTMTGDNPAFTNPSPIWEGNTVVHFDQEASLEVTTWRDSECNGS